MSKKHAYLQILVLSEPAFTDVNVKVPGEAVIFSESGGCQGCLENAIAKAMINNGEIRDAILEGVEIFKRESAKDKDEPAVEYDKSTTLDELKKNHADAMAKAMEGFSNSQPRSANADGRNKSLSEILMEGLDQVRKEFENNRKKSGPDIERILSQVLRNCAILGLTDPAIISRKINEELKKVGVSAEVTAIKVNSRHNDN
jgi:hypothetical protein